MNKKGLICLVALLGIYLAINIIGSINANRFETKLFKSVPKEIEEMSAKIIRAMEDRNSKELYEMFYSEAKNNQNLQQEIEGILSENNAIGNAENLELIGYNSNTINGTKFLSPVYELKYENTWIRTSITYIYENSGYYIYNLNYSAYDDTVHNTTGLSLLNKSIAEYMVLFFDIAIAVFALFTAGHSFGSERNKRILWMIVSLVGIGAIHFNWATGVLNINFFSIGIPTAGFSKGGTLAPIILYFRIPVGAIVYWVTLKNQQAKKVDGVNLDDELII